MSVPGEGYLRSAGSDTEMVTIWDSDQIIRQVMTLCSEVLLEGLSRRDETLAAMSKLIPGETVQRIRGAVEE